MDILFTTERFELTDLRDVLSAQGVEVHSSGQEDWGWYTDATHRGASYFVGVGGSEGQWRVMIEKRRSLVDKLRGRNRMTDDDPFAVLILSCLRDAGFTNVRTEV